MEQLNDEMDDLFRKAGEQYPLKTSDSDWDAVLGRLQPGAGEESPFLTQDGKKRNNRRRFLWLLLLLPIGLLSINYFSGSKSSNKEAVITASKLSAAQAIPGSPDDTKATDSPDATKAIPGSPDATAVKSKESTAVAPATGLTEAPASSSAESRTTTNRKRKISPATEAGDQTVFVKQRAVKTKHKRSQTGHQNDADGSLSAGNINLSSGSDQGSQAAGIAQLNPAPAQAKATDASADKNDQNASVNPGGQTNHSSSADSVKRHDGVAQTAVTKTDSAKKDISRKKTKSTAEKGIYVSLVGGPDFSTIKFQSVKNAGYSIGLLAGYRFNKHIAVEAGLFWDKKQYYTDGKYFNKSKTNIPASYDIRDLDGNCSMFEIPIALRYDFSYNRKGRFFATAGFSTYLMKKENYSYTADYGGSAWAHDVSYNNSGSNFLSILQLSGGYEYNLGGIGRLRIEPYFKIPLTGVGIGQLAISSAGLHLGITHSFR